MPYTVKKHNSFTRRQKLATDYHIGGLRNAMQSCLKTTILEWIKYKLRGTFKNGPITKRIENTDFVEIMFYSAAGHRLRYARTA